MIRFEKLHSHRLPRINFREKLSATHLSVSVLRTEISTQSGYYTNSLHLIEYSKLWLAKVIYKIRCAWKPGVLKSGHIHTYLTSINEHIDLL